jgi:hypothetical protein
MLLETKILNMRSIANSQPYRWKFLEKDGRIEGVVLTYDRFITRDKIYGAFLKTARTHGLKPYIYSINASILDESVVKRNIHIDEFEKRYAHNKLHISYLDISAKRESLVAKLLDLPRQYFQLNAGYYGDMRIEFRNFSIEEILDLLEMFLGELKLDVPLGLMQKDYEERVRGKEVLGSTRLAKNQRNLSLKST